MRLAGAVFCLCVLGYSLSSYGQKTLSPVDFVDNRLGTYNDGSNCVIGPQLPFGSINPSPQTPNGSHDGYNPDKPIRGFGQLQVSGTGWGKYGQIFVSPQIGMAVGEAGHDSPKADEEPFPYEYSVTLSRYNIRVSFTPSYHTAIYRFIFPESDSSNILIDLSHNIPHDIATNVGGEISEGTIYIDSSKAGIFGYGKYSGGFGGGSYPVYFTAGFSRSPAGFGTWKNGAILKGSDKISISLTNDRVGAFFSFKTIEDDTIYMKVAVSFKSIEKAGEWMAQETDGFDYGKIRDQAKNVWNSQLSKIQIEGASEKNMKIFYTALYHTMLMPRDRTGDMRGFSDNQPVWDDHYAVWDTWRSVYPLMVLINPDMVAGTINSFIEREKVNHMVKDAYIAGNDMMQEQGGNNVDNIISDAYVKGIKGVNWEDAYNVIRDHADGNLGRLGAESPDASVSDTSDYKNQGWIPAGEMSCSYTLEYAYNDFCAGLIARGLGKTSDAEKYFNRSTQWINLWNPDAESDGFKGFIVPKDKDGNFLNIDPGKNWGSWHNYFYEGSSWTYSFFAPHQFCRLVALNGGKEKFAEKLKYGFDHRLIDYSNEPAFLAVHTFIYAGRPDLTSYYTRQLLTQKFTATGLPGNDDSGAMSSWYIFSSLGLFPNAGQNIYYLFGSMYQKAVITLANGKQIVIEAENASPANMYVQSCILNGKKWNRAWLTHDDLKNGADIKFVMGSSPSDWARNDSTICPGSEGVSKATGLDTPAGELMIYPNPSTHIFNIQAYIPYKIKYARLSVFDIYGELYCVRDISGRGNTAFTINGITLPSGLYYLSLNGDGQNLYVSKFIKQ